MLATILKSKIATQVSINIMDAFVNMRKFIKENFIEQSYINNLVLKHEDEIDYIDNEIKNLNTLFDKFEEKEFKNKIFMNGQIYDSYSFIIDILDKNIIYHLGSSINHLGNKIFAINLIEENDIKNVLLNKIKELI